MLRRACVCALGSEDDQAVHSGTHFISEPVSPSNAFNTSKTSPLVPASLRVRCTHLACVDNQEMQTFDGLSLQADCRCEGRGFPSKHLRRRVFYSLQHMQQVWANTVAKSSASGAFITPAAVGTCITTCNFHGAALARAIPVL